MVKTEAGHGGKEASVKKIEVKGPGHLFLQRGRAKPQKWGLCPLLFQEGGCNVNGKGDPFY
jgi:hypothetical protein